MSDHDPHSRSTERDLGGHPARSLGLSTALHVVLAILLSLLPGHWRPEAARERRGSRASVYVEVARAPRLIDWPVESEPVEPVEREAIDMTVPPEPVEVDVETQLAFVDPPDWAVARDTPISAAAPIFEDLPEDLFRKPEPPVREPVEPVDLPEPEPVAAAEEAPEETVTDAPPSDAAPEVAGDVTEESPQDSVEEGEDAEERSGDLRFGARVLDAPPPRYPESARRMGKQGVVWLAIDVDRGGRVVAVRIQESSGHRVLDEAARQCVMDEWRFRPGEEDEQVETYVRSIGFEIR